MRQIKTRFSVQDHWQRKSNSRHYDLRILNPRQTTLWSWALVRHKIPKINDKVLAIRTNDHRVSYMYFQGKLENGDHVSLYDRGKCKILVSTENLMVISFNGNRLKGVYNFIKMVDSSDSWLFTKTKKL